MNDLSEAEVWVSDLTAAGWVRTLCHSYRSPEGLVYRGSFRAWLAMTTTASHQRLIEAGELEEVEFMGRA